MEFSAQQFEKLDDVEANAMALSAASMRWIGNWGFIRDNKELYRETVNILGNAKDRVKTIKLNNGALFLYNLDWFTKAIQKLVPDVFNKEFVAKANATRQGDIKRFSDYVRKAKGNRLVFGIYSHNAVDVISINGKDIPAFKISYEEMVTVVKQIGGYTVCSPQELTIAPTDTAVLAYIRR